MQNVIGHPATRYNHSNKYVLRPISQHASVKSHITHTLYLGYYLDKFSLNGLFDELHPEKGARN